MVSLAGAWAAQIFLISMAGMAATTSGLAQFASIYPGNGSFITYVTRAIGTKVAVAIGVTAILGYVIASGGLYLFAGSYLVRNVFGHPRLWGLTQIVTIVNHVLVVAPVVVGLRSGSGWPSPSTTSRSVSVTSFLCLVLNPSVPSAPMVDVLIRKRIPYLGGRRSGRWL
jgi:amino acid transporter